MFKPTVSAFHAIDMLELDGFETYAVGGCIRDTLLGITPHDWDIATAATPDEIIAAFPSDKVIPTGIKHGTVTLVFGGETVEITSFRTEGTYADGRRPDSVEFIRDPKLDLARRDFTMNAIAWSPTRGMLDPFGGEQDINAKIIRCVGDPKERFSEDALRILRALRFASTLGFQIEEKTAQAIHETRELLSKISAERIFAELVKLLTGKYVTDILLKFADVFAVIIPELAPCIGFDQQNPHHCHTVWDHTAYAVGAVDDDPILRLCMLLHDIGKPAAFKMGEDGFGHFKGHQKISRDMSEVILRRLRCPNLALDTLLLLIEIHDIELPTTEIEMRHFLSTYGSTTLFRLFLVRRADVAAQSDHKREEKLARVDLAEKLLVTVSISGVPLTIHDLEISGSDFLDLGLQPGPAVGRGLNELLELVMSCIYPNDRNTLLALAKIFVEKENAGKNEPQSCE